MGYSPLFLMLPCCMAVSISFMLPSSGSVAALCYSYGHFTILQMACIVCNNLIRSKNLIKTKLVVLQLA